jgi:hypothetical protein
LSEGFDSIFVVVDRYTKQTHLIPTTKDVDAEGIAKIFLNHVWKHHGTPKKVISDRGTQFTSKFMGQVSKRLGINWSMSTAYHPRTDGQTERINQEVEQYLRLFTSYRQNDWVDWLPIAEFAHNNSVTVTGHSPFKVLYGYNPDFTISPNSASNVPAADERSNEMKEAREDAEAMLRMANERMKRYYDRNIKEAPQFKKGDLVWLEAKNIRQKRPNKKLSDRRLGPFEVIEKTGDVNYRLKLPQEYKIHPVFHVELLTAHTPSTLLPRNNFSRPPPEIEGDNGPEWSVERVIDSRLHRSKLQYLVQWEGYPISEATWEPEVNLRNAPLEVQEFHQKNPKAVNPHKIGKSLFTTSEFLEFRKNFIRPYKAFGNSRDARPRKGVMSQTPRSNPNFNPTQNRPQPTPNPTFTIVPTTPIIPLAPTTRVTHVEVDDDDEDEEMFHDCD